MGLKGEGREEGDGKKVRKEKMREEGLRDVKKIE